MSLDLSTLTKSMQNTEVSSAQEVPRATSPPPGLTERGANFHTCT